MNLIHCRRILIERAVSPCNLGHGYRSEQDVLLGNYTTYFKESQFAPVRDGIHEPDAQFTLKKSFLEQVSENADEYIAHPEKLDWSWLIQSIKSS